MKLKFYICRHCGNIIIKIENSGVPVVCCGDAMEELIPGVVDASIEKHVPVVNINNGVVNVKIGEQPHPMTAEHHISWVAIETDNGYLIKYLKENQEPVVDFITNDNVIATYAYCNLHGLWKSK